MLRAFYLANAPAQFPRGSQSPFRLADAPDLRPGRAEEG
jgi:hypothetical protein